MQSESYDAQNLDRFRLVDSALAGTSTDSWGIELSVRALAGSRAPVLPTPDGLAIDHTQYLAYWHGLHFLTVARLGWRDPGQGLRAWNDLGRPSIDPTIDFIGSVWGQDGSLDAYIAWATLNHEQFGDQRRPATVPSPSWVEWSRRVREEPQLSLLDGGSNPPHLGTAEDETEAICDQSRESVLTIADLDRRRAVYITGYGGFYKDLRRRWDELPAVAPQNWRVEVFNRRLGYIGEYRLSRTTGRLHSGKHSIHMLGN